MLSIEQRILRSDLLALAAKLEKVPRKDFDFHTVASGVGHVLKDKRGGGSCGAAGCAVGWMATMPQFRDRGMGLNFEGRGKNLVLDGVTIDGQSTYYVDAACAVLPGLSHDDAGGLFTPDSYFTDPSGREHYAPGSNATPKQVAQHIRTYVKTVLDAEE